MTNKETPEVAISDRIKAEAKRTIEGMQRFYANYSNDVDDAEELEHRIARVEASMEGCNGLSQDDKIQKTAENVFELTCAQERSYDSLRRELKINRDEYRRECEEIRRQSAEDFKVLKDELKNGLDGVMKKIEDSGTDSSSSGASKTSHSKVLLKLISDHPLMTFNTFIFFLMLVFVSGHFDLLAKLCQIGGK